MKKLAIVVLIVFAGCHRQVKVASTPTATTEASASGAASPREAVQKFMATAKAQDIQAMADIWGTQAGPARATIEKDEMEKRLIYLMRCLRHDSYAIVGETPVVGGDRLFSVQVKLGNLAPISGFTATPGPKSRWYVKGFEPEPLNSICTAR